jgi:CubicO group peptidase (beta-lactamase class C family)
MRLPAADRRPPRPHHRALRAAVLTVLLAPAAAAQAQTFVPTRLVGEAVIDDRALAGWLDRWFARQLADPQTGAPGAVVAVVEGGRIVLVRGYGYANLEQRIPATGSTVVRVGSLSKPVTATAVRQLVEAGRIDPRRPVSDYVPDLPLPTRFGRPVTVLDLVTHTAGFDVRLEDTAAPSDAEILPLGRYVRDHLPPQVRRSGEVPAYSNHGYALLGHLVEAVSGEVFESYVASHVFQPLGMTSSSFRLTPEVERKAAVGYQRDSGGLRPALVVHPRIYPAAGLNTTAEDMARFLAAHLGGGGFGRGRVLSAASVEEMHRQQFAVSPGVPGMAFGFFEYPFRGTRALVHGGGIRGFMSGLALWPERRLGLFVANNGYSDWMVRDLVTDFARRYLPEYTRPVAQRDDSGRLERYAGSYRPLVATVGTLEKAGALRNNDLEVDAGFWNGLNVGGNRFVAVGGGAFREDYGDEMLWMVERAGAGRVLVVTADPVNGVVGFERVPWYATARCHREILWACCAVFVSVLAAWPPRRPRAHDRSSAGRQPGAARAARGLLAVVAGLNLLALALMVAAFRSGKGAGMLFGLPGPAAWAVQLFVVAAALGLPLLAGAWPVWRAHGWPVRSRVHFTVGVAACLAFAGWARYWNLLGR